MTTEERLATALARITELEIELSKARNHWPTLEKMRLDDLHRMAWKKVSEGLPPEGEVVLTMEDGSVTENYIPYAASVTEPYRGRWNSGHPFVSHWMHKPQPLFLQVGICTNCDDGIIYNGSKGQVEHIETGFRRCSHGPIDARYADGTLEIKNPVSGVAV